MLNKSVVNYTAGRWIGKSTIWIFDEKPLSNSLVDNDESHFWDSLGFVVQILDDLPELTDLLSEYLFSHSIANTISEDNEVLREFSIMARSK